MPRRWGLALAVLLSLLVGPPVWAEGRVLIFSHTTGFRHDAIPTAIAALTEVAHAEGMTAQASEDPRLFDRAETLAAYDAIVLLSTTTDPKKPESEWLVGPRRAALQAYLRGGGGIVAVHAAADSHYGWDWYTRMIGGRFRRHPPGTPVAAITRRDAAHPATRPLPTRFDHRDEYYYYDRFDPAVTLLLSFDPVSIGEAAEGPQPIAWSHRFGGGRVFYTGLGHAAESYAEPLFRAHLAGGLRWARRR